MSRYSSAALFVSASLPSLYAEILLPSVLLRFEPSPQIPGSVKPNASRSVKQVVALRSQPLWESLGDHMDAVSGNELWDRDYSYKITPIAFTMIL